MEGSYSAALYTDSLNKFYSAFIDSFLGNVAVEDLRDFLLLEIIDPPKNTDGNDHWVWSNAAVARVEIFLASRNIKVKVYISESFRNY